MYISFFALVAFSTFVQIKLGRNTEVGVEILDSSVCTQLKPLKFIGSLSYPIFIQHMPGQFASYTP